MENKKIKATLIELVGGPQDGRRHNLLPPYRASLYFKSLMNPQITHEYIFEPREEDNSRPLIFLYRGKVGEEKIDREGGEEELV